MRADVKAQPSHARMCRQLDKKWGLTHDYLIVTTVPESKFLTRTYDMTRQKERTSKMQSGNAISSASLLFSWHKR